MSTGVVAHQPLQWTLVRHHIHCHQVVSLCMWIFFFFLATTSQKVQLS